MAMNDISHSFFKSYLILLNITFKISKKIHISAYRNIIYSHLCTVNIVFLA